MGRVFSLLVHALEGSPDDAWLRDVGDPYATVGGNMQIHAGEYDKCIKQIRFIEIARHTEMSLMAERTLEPVKIASGEGVWNQRRNQQQIITRA
ncbi:MAG: hypothetical protein MnENMB40S_02810 [Rhizobiaceae bacterium MnEN-MB40S]|nr:MAG: hypothetical protein MnENMB40S_02810 [Rhizobiaceae bacterium MnEN-MB40S]